MNNIIMIGMKSCGKTTVANLLAQKTNSIFIDSDREIEKLHLQKKGEVLTFREIYAKYGQKYFEQLDFQSLQIIMKRHKDTKFVLASAGRTPLNADNQKMLKKMGRVIFLNTNPEILLNRISKTGIPSFFAYPKNPEKSLAVLLKERLPVYQKLADYTIDSDDETPDVIVKKILKLNL